jgi:hypothetical protein
MDMSFFLPRTPQCFLALKSWVLLAFVSLGSFCLMAEAGTQMKGMSGEIEVKPAKELSLTAPSGEYVAVLDQRPTEAAADKVQDHHNAWLVLTMNQIDGGLIKVKGKCYIPGTTENPPREIRVRILKPAIEGGMAAFAEKMMKLDQAADQWADFEIELPLGEVDPLVGDQKTPRASDNFILALSAAPLAGPLYLDNLQVSDLQGNELWEFPEFE